MMTARSKNPNNVELQKRAEEELVQQEGSAPVLQMDFQRMLHEMKVHQIEIEMENEDLRKMQSEAREMLQLVGTMAEDQLRLHFPGAHILLVESEAASDEVAKGLLESIGMKVEVAGNGADAIELAKRNEYKLILADTPGLDMGGENLAQAIHAIPGREDIPILVMDEDRQRGLAAGMSGHIGKPVNPQQLYGAMLHWLARRGS